MIWYANCNCIALQKTVRIFFLFDVAALVYVVVVDVFSHVDKNIIVDIRNMLSCVFDCMNNIDKTTPFVYMIFKIIIYCNHEEDINVGFMTVRWVQR